MAIQVDSAHFGTNQERLLTARRLREPSPSELGRLKESREVDRQMKIDNSRVMTVKELSDYLKVHPSTVYRQLKRGQLPAFKVGSDWRFNVESIDRWRLEQDTFGNGDGR